MYSLLNRVPGRELLVRHAPTFLGALVVAEMFYKWKSFLLETAGFLITWYLLDATVSLVEKLLRKDKPARPPG